MKPAFYKTIMIALLSVLYLASSTAAETFSKELRGKIQTSANKTNLSIFLLDKSGTILDITRPDKQGNFRLDLSVMDLPVFEEVNKLKVRISDKKGNDKQIEVAEELQEFNRTSTLKPVTFP